MYLKLAKVDGSMDIIFNELENDPMGLQEAGLDSIVLKQVVQPANFEGTVLSGLSSNTKNAIRNKPSNNLAYIPMHYQASSGSNSSASSYNGSVMQLQRQLQFQQLCGNCQNETSTLAGLRRNSSCVRCQTSPTWKLRSAKKILDPNN